MREFFDRARDLDVQRVACELGLAARPGRSLSPCPSCGAEQRGADDRRGPVGVNASSRGWACHRCRAQGDALSLLAIALTGSARPPSWDPVRAWLEGAQVERLTPPAPTAREPVRPPAEEVLELWARSNRVTAAAEASAWLRSRGLEPALVEDLDLARALPARGLLPAWAGARGQDWRASGHVVLLPLVDRHGGMVSIRARAIAAEARPKALAPAGAEVRGLVLVDELARRLLAGEAAAAELVRDVGLVVVEGEPDFLSWSTLFGTDGELERAPAVVGLVAGSWDPQLVARIPAGIRVWVRTHVDATGDRYAEKVVASLADRCEVLRLREAS